MSKCCFECGNSNAKEISVIYGYAVCNACKPHLGLYKDDTIRKAVKSYARKREVVPENPTYKEDVDYRLKIMEERYIKARIKMLHIQARLKELS